jgi:hypothetical protein
LPHLATIEKRGIPSVFIIYEDQDECFEQAAKLNGIPHLRRVNCSRTLPGPEDINRWIEPLMDALVRPLTAAEKKGGTWEEPDKRILFEGTLEEANEFYQQTMKVPQIKNAPFAIYTDGMPIVIPTEERVAAMLKGTSHKADEIIRYQTTHRLGDRVNQMGSSGIKGEPVYYMPMRRMATVEKIATIGVMAGCKPEHMPILLTIAESGGCTSDGRGGGGFCVSGPIAKEIGMNFSVNVLGPGNPSNRCLGRAGDLMWRNLGQQIPGVNNCGVYGGGISNIFPENDDALPPGWSTLREEFDFKKSDSVLIPAGAGGGGTHFSPGGYRAFQKSGHGGIARRLGVKGVPGPKNWIGYEVPGWWKAGEGGISIIMLPQMAMHLYKAGFKTKDDVYEWIYKQSFMTVKEYRTHSWPDMRTNAWKAIEKTSGKPWLELPDDYMVPACEDPFSNMIIVTGEGEEMALIGGGRMAGMDGAWSIDAWR